MLKRGFTLIELLVALALLGVVLMLVFDSFTFQQQTYAVVDQVSETQQSSRAIARLIERDIRNAGYLVPDQAASCGVDNDDAPDLLFLSDTDAILPADELPVALAGDDLAAVASDDPAAIGSLDVDVEDTVLDETPSYDTDGNSVNDSDFRVGGGAILVDLGNADRGVACGIVTAVVPTGTRQVEVDFLTVLDANAPQAKDLRLVPAHVYRIVPASDPPRLERSGVMLAKDVEDFQVAWYYDDDGDRRIDDPGETRGDANTDYDPSAIDADALREIRINLVLRTRGDDIRNPTAAGTGQARENRTVSVPGDDGKRRRVHTATVRLRNLTL